MHLEPSKLVYAEHRPDPRASMVSSPGKTSPKASLGGHDLASPIIIAIYLAIIITI